MTRTAARFDAALGVAVPAGCELRFESLPDAPFGVVVRGIEWQRPNRATVATLMIALRRHLLLVFRGQPSPTEQQLDEFFRGLGRLVLDTDDGRFHYRSHIGPAGPISDMARDSFQYLSRNADNSGSSYYTPGADGQAELVWHNDQSHRPMLKVLSVFEAIDIEESVVPTEFRDHYTAYETLADELRWPLENKQVVFYDPRMAPPNELPRLADAMHPVFTPHPHSGRKAIYVNDFADRIVGLDRADSDRTMACLRAHIDSHAPRYLHRWQPGDMVVWDNVGLQHRRDPVPPLQRRSMRQYGGLAE